MPISFSEYVYLRHATLWCRRAKEIVTRIVIDKVFAENNENYEDAATTAKFIAVKNTIKHLYGRASNPYFFVPCVFGCKDVRKGVKGEILCKLIEFCDELEPNEVATNTNMSLPGYNRPLMFLEKNACTVANAAEVVMQAFLELKTSERANDVLRDFTAAYKAPSLIPYLLYEARALRASLSSRR